MAKREIKFSLVYRDMWQSSGRYQPRVDQLVRVAPAIVDMGCFDRVETNGGAFEQVNLLYGENPNVAVRQWTAPPPQGGHPDPYAGARPQRHPHVPRPGGRPRTDVQGEEGAGHRHRPFLLRPERPPQPQAFRRICQESRHDFAGGPVHHPLPRAHGGLLPGCGGEAGRIRHR